MLRLILILFTAFLPLIACANTIPRNADDAISMLDSMLDMRDSHPNIASSSIDSLKRRLSNPNKAYTTSPEELGDLYRRINLDSALTYYRKGLKNSENHDRIIMKISSLMPVNGMTREAIEMRASIPADSLSQSDLLLYYSTGFDLYQYIVAFYPDGPDKDRYLAESYNCNDSLIKYLPHDSPLYKYHAAVKSFADKDFTAAIASLNEAVGDIRFNDNLFARATSLMSQCYEANGRQLEKLYYLTLSAASDLAAGTKETTSLQKLGREMYSMGDVNRAYRYLMYALENSLESGSKIRTVESAEALPIIAASFDSKDADSHRLLVIFIIILSAAIVTCLILLIFNYLSRRKMQKLQADLTYSNNTKDRYIQQVLSLCSSYVDQIEDFNRLAARKIKAGQVQDFYEMVESGKILQSKTEKFLSNFDEAFLSIYPGFVEHLNKLFTPDKRITPPNSRSLTPELRILAFMRLGIDDCAKIAKFLGLSVNTVYTYRNKLKNRAADRENFESDIMKIGAINLK